MPENKIVKPAQWVSPAKVVVGQTGVEQPTKLETEHRDHAHRDHAR